MTKSPSKKLVSSAIILAVGGLVTKIIGATYRIPLTNLLGEEGIGLYQLVFPFYVLLLNLSSTGLPSAISKLTAQKLKAGDEEGAHRIFTVSLFSLLLIGGACSLLPVILGSLVAKITGNEGISCSYLFISPAVLFVSAISAFRGYFQGRMNMIPTAASQIIEQAVKAGLSVYFAFKFMPDVYKAVGGVVLSISLSELAALVFLTVYYLLTAKTRPPKIEEKVVQTANKMQGATAAVLPENVLSLSDCQEKLRTEREEKRQKRRLLRKELFKTLREIYSLSIPVTAAALLLPLSQIADMIITVGILNNQGLSGTALFGLLSGPVFSLVSLPIVLCSGISTAAIPHIASDKIQPSCENLNGKISFSLKLTYFIAIPAAFLLLVFAKDASRLLYPGLTENSIFIMTKLLRISAVSVVFIALMQTTMSVLISVSKVKIGTLNLLIGVVVKLILSYTLISIPSVNIYGGAISAASCYLVAGLLNLYYIIRYTGKVPKANTAKLILAAFSAAVLGLLAAGAVQSSLLKLILGFAAAGVVYIALVLVLKIFSEHELGKFPLIERFRDRKSVV